MCIELIHRWIAGLDSVGVASGMQAHSVAHSATQVHKWLYKSWGPNTSEALCRDPVCDYVDRILQRSG